MKTRKLVITAAVLLAIGGGYGWWSGRDEAPTGKAAAKETPPPEVLVTELETRNFAERLDALGTVRSDESIEITANVTETVAQVSFDDGQLVEKGYRLTSLNSDEERALLGGAEAALAEQEREIRRLQGLVKDGAVSEVRLQEYQTQRDMAVQRVRAIQAMLDDREIRAPFSGKLGIRRVSPGALVSPGTVITTLDKLDPVKLDFTIPETFIRMVKIGRSIEAASAAHPGELLGGTITHVDPRVDPVTRSVTVRARMDNPETKLLPGMLLTVVLRGDPRQGIALPERAVITEKMNHVAFVVLDDGNGGAKVQRVGIQLGIRQPGYVEVIAGLRKGQRVVTDGLLGLVDGKAVRVKGNFAGPSAPYNPVSPSPGR